MNIIVIIIVLFILGSLIGFYFEKIILKTLSTGDRFISDLFAKYEIPDKYNVFLTMYGTGFVFLYLINLLFSNISSFNVLTISLFSAIILSIFECVIGQVSTKYFGERGWNYEENKNISFSLPTICNGYVALGSFSLWFIGSLVFSYSYKIITKNKTILI